MGTVVGSQFFMSLFSMLEMIFGNENCNSRTKKVLETTNTTTLFHDLFIVMIIQTLMISIVLGFGYWMASSKQQFSLSMTHGFCLFLSLLNIWIFQRAPDCIPLSWWHFGIIECIVGFALSIAT